MCLILYAFYPLELGLSVIFNLFAFKWIAFYKDLKAITHYKLNAKTAAAFVIANMIGTGVFTSLGFQLLANTNATSIALIWLIGGITALCGAFVYSELGAATLLVGWSLWFVAKRVNDREGKKSDRKLKQETA